MTTLYLLFWILGGTEMYSTVVLITLFVIALIVLWLFLINLKVHDKIAKKTDKFTEENFGETKGENAE